MAFSTPSEFEVNWEKSFNSGDLQGLLDLYADDVYVVVEPGVSVSGKDQLKAALEQFLAAQPASVKFGQCTTVDQGATAVTYAPWTASITGPEGEIPMGGDAVVVLSKGSAGWLAVIDDFYGKG